MTTEYKDDNVIFTDLKSALGVVEDDDAFDIDLRINIDTALAILQQLGVNDGFVQIADGTTWTEYYAQTAPNPNFGLVKSFMLLKIKLAFDPPTGSTMTYLQAYLKELEWRIKEAYTGNYTYPIEEGENDE